MERNGDFKRKCLTRQLTLGAFIGFIIGLVALGLFIIFEFTGEIDYPKHDTILAIIVGPFPNLITGIIISFAVGLATKFNHTLLVNIIIGIVLGILLGLILASLMGFFVGQFIIDFDMYAPLVGIYIGVFQGPVAGCIIGFTIARKNCLRK